MILDAHFIDAHIIIIINIIVSIILITIVRKAEVLLLIDNEEF